MSDLANQLEPPVPAEEIAAADVAEQPAKDAPVAKEGEQKEIADKDKTVPHGAFHEEREKRKKLQADLEQERQQRAAEKAVLTDRLSQIWQATQQPQQPQFRDPNNDPDPLAAMQHNQNLTLQQMHELRNQQAREAQQRQQVEQEHRFTSHVNALEAEFSSTTPDYVDALNFVRGRRISELKALGYPQEQISAIVYQNAQMIASDALRMGANPAERIYQMAVATGYVKKGTSAEVKMETLQKGVEASKKLGNGGVDTGHPTAEQIADMSDDEFATFKSGLKKKGQNLSEALK